MQMVKNVMMANGQDVMIASLVVSVAQSHGRSDDGQCDDHVGQCEVDAIITLVSDHIIGQCHTWSL